MKDMPSNLFDAQECLSRSCGCILKNTLRIAVAISGGPDSMALWFMLCQWSRFHEGPEVHALHVDHGLRAESGLEAEKLKDVIGNLTVLKWEGNKPVTRVQEEARFARYDLMTKYCKEHDIAHLLLAHHEDDQAETLLFRLAKGSGLDGLAGMPARSGYDENLELVRPLLDVPKEKLVAYCKQNDLSYIEDPSNENDKFARVRLRQSREILEEEGLSAKRLSVTAKRLSRARLALDKVANDLYKHITLEKDTQHGVLKLEEWQDAPDEIALRVLQKAMSDLSDDNGYGPRMERLEDLFEDMRRQPPFRRRTLGGIIFERDDKSGQIILKREAG